jgi:hypothetical protein
VTVLSVAGGVSLTAAGSNFSIPIGSALDGVCDPAGIVSIMMFFGLIDGEQGRSEWVTPKMAATPSRTSKIGHTRSGRTKDGQKADILNIGDRRQEKSSKARRLRGPRPTPRLAAWSPLKPAPESRNYLASDPIALH